jgi:hypothetical protein
MRKPFPLGKPKGVAEKVGFSLPSGSPAHDPNPDLDPSLQSEDQEHDHDQEQEQEWKPQIGRPVIFIAEGTLF